MKKKTQLQSSSQIEMGKDKTAQKKVMREQTDQTKIPLLFLILPLVFSLYLLLV